jgi:hypothetical protein
MEMEREREVRLMETRNEINIKMRSYLSEVEVEYERSIETPEPIFP